MNIKVTYTTDSDVENYIRMVFHGPKHNYGRTDLKKRLLQNQPEEIRDLFLNNLSEEDVRDGLTKILDSNYAKSPEYFEKKINNLTENWLQVGKQIEYCLTRLYNRPFPFADEILTVKFTTAGICPYDYVERMIYNMIDQDTQRQVRIILHELNHFMFYYYFPELKETLGEANYELLKESLTFFTNPEQSGKPGERPLRDLYSTQRWESIDDAIKAGSALLITAAPATAISPSGNSNH